ncbi:MAG: hypothetical protein LUH22_09485 [Bacteroides sp.]|nr:hypothetical protein [Bacteroides sp.]
MNTSFAERVILLKGLPEEHIVSEIKETDFHGYKDKKVVVASQSNNPKRSQQKPAPDSNTNEYLEYVSVSEIIPSVAFVMKSDNEQLNNGNHFSIRANSFNCCLPTLTMGVSGRINENAGLKFDGSFCYQGEESGTV